MRSMADPAGVCQPISGPFSGWNGHSCTPHALRSRIPIDGRRLEFTAALPRDLQTVLDEIVQLQEAAGDG